MRVASIIALFLVASPALADLRAMECGAAWDRMVATFPDLNDRSSVPSNITEEHFRFVSAADVYTGMADMVAGREPEATGANEAALGQIARAFALSERVMVCSGGPVLLGTAQENFRADFDAFNAQFSTEDRYETQLTWGAYE